MRTREILTSATLRLCHSRVRGLVLLMLSIFSAACRDGDRPPAPPADAAAEKSVAALTTLGGPNDIGLIGDVALDPADGRVYVLDVAERTVHVYGADATPIARMGRGGQGPGELFDPVALAVDGTGRVLVLDAVRRRLEAFDREGRYSGSTPLDFHARDICISEGRLFASGLREGRLIHEVSMANGRTLRSFGDDPQQADPELSLDRMGGYLQCGPGGTLTYFPTLRGELWRLSANTGQRLGTAEIPGHVAVQVRRLANGIEMRAPRDGPPADYAAAVVPLSPREDLVQIGHPRRGGQGQEFETIRSFVVTWPDGTIRPAPVGLPRIMAVRGDTAMGVLTEPFPQVRTLPLSAALEVSRGR